MQCKNVNSKQNGVLKLWGDNQKELEMVTVSGGNAPKEETCVNANSPQSSNILTIKGYYVLAQLHLHHHSFQKLVKEGRASASSI